MEELTERISCKSVCVFLLRVEELFSDGLVDEDGQLASPTPF